MSTALEARSQEQINSDADKAVQIILAGFDAPEFNVEAVCRRAYLLGRHDSNAQNLDRLIKVTREQA